MMMSLRLLLVLFCGTRQAAAAMMRGAKQPPLEKPKARRVAWFSPPKTGSIFGNTVIHWANPSMPAGEPGEHHLRYHFGSWMEKNEASLKGSLWIPGNNRHTKVSKEDFDAFGRDWVGMFRDPELRTIANFNDKAHGKGDIKIYAKRMEGSVVKELAGQEDGEAFACWPGFNTVVESDILHANERCGGRGINDTHQAPQKPDLELAMRRLKSGFKFIGLTSQYNLAVCLFHTMFGGDCSPAEVAVQKQGYANGKHPLKGYRDPYDGELYQEAKKRFFELIKKHNVTEESCQRTCPGVFGSGSDTMLTFSTGW